MIDRPGPRPSEEFKRLYTAVIQDAKRGVLPCHSDAFAKLKKHCEETGEVPRSLCVFIDVRGVELEVLPRPDSILSLFTRATRFARSPGACSEGHACVRRVDFVRPRALH